jgi:hypothetical protein
MHMQHVKLTDLTALLCMKVCSGYLLLAPLVLYAVLNADIRMYRHDIQHLVLL